MIYRDHFSETSTMYPKRQRPRTGLGLAVGQACRDIESTSGTYICYCDKDIVKRVRFPLGEAQPNREYQNSVDC